MTKNKIKKPRAFAVYCKDNIIAECREQNGKRTIVIYTSNPYHVGYAGANWELGKAHGYLNRFTNWIARANEWVNDK